jgi:transposase
VATNVLGKSGRAMLEDIITGEDNPEHLASLALGHLRVKIPQLRLALEGKIRFHHRFLLRRLLDQIQFVEQEIALLDERLEDIGRRRPDLAQAVARWDTIPGIDRVAAWAFLAEVGDNMGQFPTAEHLASWAALCPGNHESAGKRLQLAQHAHARLAMVDRAELVQVQQFRQLVGVDTITFVSVFEQSILSRIAHHQLGHMRLQQIVQPRRPSSFFEGDR